MDAVTGPQQNEQAVTQLRPVDSTRAPGALAATPPEAPLAMPAQSLSEFDPAARHKDIAVHKRAWCWLTRVFVFGGALALTVYGGHEMYRVVDVGGVTPLEWALLLLFIANFSWIALACASTLAGFIWL
ncbi:MAG: glucan biosynthesis glucosyltransferase H, partial [Beijerinckiaceae bacterium]|nr:glucan biosynthesis glucosyltransferase H [Beijerinckiaceae bacterium]